MLGARPTQALVDFLTAEPQEGVASFVAECIKEPLVESAAHELPSGPYAEAIARLVTREPAPYALQAPGLPPAVPVPEGAACHGFDQEQQSRLASAAAVTPAAGCTGSNKGCNLYCSSDCCCPPGASSHVDSLLACRRPCTAAADRHTCRSA